MVKIDPLEDLLVHGSKLGCSSPRQFSETIPEERALPHVGSKSPRAREGRTHEPETPPEVPGDVPVEQNPVFRETPPKAILKLQNDLPDALGNSPNASGSTLNNSIIWDFPTKTAHKNH